MGLDADIENLFGRPLDGSPVPCIWLDATYVKCRREGRAASTAVVTAIGCDAGDWRRVLGVDVVDTEPYDSWPAFLRVIHSRGAAGARPVVSDARPGLVRAIGEAFQGAVWQRRAVRLVRDCIREAGSWQPRRRVGRIVSQVPRHGTAGAARGRGHARAGRDVTGETRYFSEARMNGLCDDGRTRGIDGPVEWARLGAEAGKMLESGLELADRVEAA